MAFFKRIIEVQCLGDRFQAVFPGREDDPTGGRGKFGRWLRDKQAAVPTFREVVKAVLIVSDNDDDPPASFLEVKRGLQNSGGFGVPDREQAVARSAGFPDVAVLMVPIGERGNLETLCVRAAYRKWPVRGPLDAFVAATDAVQWNIGKQSKMRMQTILAATCAPKPDVSFTWHWQQSAEYHVPLNDPEFSSIADFLHGFAALLSGP